MIFSNFIGVKKTIKFMLITNLISRYMRLWKAAFSAEDGAKLNKSIQTNKRHGNAFSFDGHPKEM